MRKPTGRPVGRPWKLTPDQEARVYAAYTAAKHGSRFRVLMDFAREFSCGPTTLERVIVRHRQQESRAS